jgi:DNA-binding transcriptional LysR family regulator
VKLSAYDLRLFAAIADTGGITAAAQKLGLTKSFVSRELAALESTLGTRLVQRTTRRVSLTDTGDLLASYARRVVEEIENAEAAIEAAREAPRGELKVTAPFSIIRFILAPRLKEFRARYPDVKLSLDASMRIVDLVEEGVDVAIRIGALPSSSLVARRLAMVPQILAAAPDYLKKHGTPKTPADLIHHDIINLKKDAAPDNWSLEGDGDSAQVAVRPVIAIHDPGILLDLVVQGLGIGVVPSVYAERDLKARRIVRVLPEYRRAMIPVHALYPSRRMLAPKVRAFVEFAAEIIEQRCQC